MTKLSRILKRHYYFDWFLDTWTVKQKWMYVALYVVLFKLGQFEIEVDHLLLRGSSSNLPTDGLLSAMMESELQTVNV